MKWLKAIGAALVFVAGFLLAAVAFFGHLLPKQVREAQDAERERERERERLLAQARAAEAAAAAAQGRAETAAAVSAIDAKTEEMLNGDAVYVANDLLADPSFGRPRDGAGGASSG